MGLQDILSSTGGTNISEFEGQVVEIVGADFDKGQFGDYVKLTLRTEDGETEQATSGGVAIVRKVRDLVEGDFLPVSVRVTSYPGQFGNKGYDIRDPNEPQS